MASVLITVYGVFQSLLVINCQKYQYVSECENVEFMCEKERKTVCKCVFLHLCNRRENMESRLCVVCCAEG